VAVRGCIALTPAVVLGKIAIRNTIRHKIDMPDLTFDFTWHKDPKGYRLVPAKLPRLRPGQSPLDVPSIGIEPARIVRNGGALQSYRPLEHFPALFDRFIRTATSEKGVLEFVEKFGPLTHDGLRGKGEIVLDVVDQARDMARYGGRGLGKLNAWIEVDHEGMRLKVKPTCLLDALWLQLAQANPRSRVCPQCRKSFLIGVAVNRRKDAQFCTDECRIKFNSLKRSR
jgi:hypothetical protein